MISCNFYDFQRLVLNKCELIEGTMHVGWRKVGDWAKSLCASPNHDKGETRRQKPLSWLG